MRKNGITASVSPDPPGEALGREQRGRQPSPALQVGVRDRIAHSLVFALDLRAVFGGYSQRRESQVKRRRRPAEPLAQFLARLAEAQSLAVMDEINDRAVIRIVAHREVNVMAVSIALDDDLVAAPAHDRGAAPALALIELIAYRDGILPQIDVSFELVQLRVQPSLRLKSSVQFPSPYPGVNGGAVRCRARATSPDAGCSSGFWAASPAALNPQLMFSLLPGAPVW